MKPTCLFAFLFVGLFSTTFAHPVLQTPPSIVPKWDVYELTIQDTSTYNNPFWDVTIQGEFTGPSSEKIHVNGFYYDGDLWKVRMAPTREGSWTFRLIFSSGTEVDTLTGSFQCTAPEAGNHGFILVNPAYPHKFMYSDTTLFIPNGVGGHTPATQANYLNIWPQSSYDTAQVPAFWDTLSKYSVNTFRLMLFNQSAFEVPFYWNTYESTANFFSQTGGLDRYNTFVGKAMDRWFQQAQKHNISIYLCLFSTLDTPTYPFSTSVFSTDNGGPYSTLDSMYEQTSGPGFDFEKKYVQYLVDRYAAYRNIVLWEYNNEYGARCLPAWLAAMNEVIQAHDPYNRARTVSFWWASFSRQSNVDAQSSLTVTDDHFYSQADVTYRPSNADSATNAQARYRFATYQKPVMFSEMGSEPGEETDYWSRFQRAAYWGAFTGGGTPLFWLSGGLEDQGFLYNQGDVHFMGAVHKLVERFEDFNTMVPDVSITLTSPNTLRIFSLASDNEALYYIHNYSDDQTQTTGSNLAISLRNSGSQSFSGVWLNATTGDSIGSVKGQFNAGSANISIPEFTDDVLLYLRKTVSTGILTVQDPSAKFALDQNFPNPFSPTTVIRYQIPVASLVNLKVYDLSGKVVAILVNEKQLPGSYQITFNGATLPAGIYFYRMQAGDLVETRKFMILR